MVWLLVWWLRLSYLLYIRKIHEQLTSSNKRKNNKNKRNRRYKNNKNKRLKNYEMILNSKRRDRKMINVLNKNCYKAFPHKTRNYFKIICNNRKNQESLSNKLLKMLQVKQVYLCF